LLKNELLIFIYREAYHYLNSDRKFSLKDFDPEIWNCQEAQPEAT
jgi:hypothetical protein